MTAAVPAVWIKFAGTEAVSCVDLPNVVGSVKPFQDTVAPWTNPLPFTVILKAGPPAVTVVGPNELIVGAADGSAAVN